MAKKEKEQKPVLSLDGEEYVIEDMSDEQKQMINHINDMQNKLNTNAFVKEQLEVGKEAFINMLRGALEAKEEPEVVEAEEVEAEA
jgi:hypothetical protein|tara:strand:- start:404 stop:661 length:258 start_codon:yes stop_codon:yes gene_type:complete